MSRVANKYAWYVVAVMFAAYTCSFVDRTILNLLVTPIKLDLGISDTQMSLLQGAAFAIFYVVMGLVLARLADKYSRRMLIVVGMTLWCLATAGGALADSFAMLFLLRIGVGVGEASLTPAATSMLADLFPKERLNTAISVYLAGPYFGVAIALMAGGSLLDYLGTLPQVTIPLLGEVRSWQATFLFVGLPGVILALIVLTTIREPERVSARTTNQSKDDATFRDFFQFLGGHRSVFGRHFVGFSMFSLLGYAMSSWLPTYYIREFGLTNSEIGSWLGTGLFFGGTLGIVCGGITGDWLMKRRPDAPIITGIIATFGAVVFASLVVLMPTAKLSFMAVLPAYFFATLPMGTAMAALHIITPSTMRARITAVYIFCDAMIGLGFGATAVALLTDFVFADESKLGYSLLVVAIISMTIALAALGSVKKPYRAMVESMESAS